MAVPADITRPYSQTARYGVAVGIRTQNPEWPTVILRTSDNGSVAPATSAQIILTQLPPSQLYFEDLLPNDGAYRWYGAYHHRPGYDPGPSSSTWVGAAPVNLNDWISPYQDFQTEGKRRTDTLYDTDSVLKDVVRQDSASVSRVMLRGYLTGETSDGGVVTFAQNYNSAPTVIFSGGLVYQPASSKWTSTFVTTGTQYVATEAQALTVSGFTLYAKLYQASGVSSTGVYFPIASDLTSEGATVGAPASSAPTTPKYTFHYNVTEDVVPDPGESYGLEVQLAFDSYDGASWTERKTTWYGLSATSQATQTWTSESNFISVFSSQLGASSTDTMRMRIKTVNEFGKGAATFSVHGYSSSGPDANFGVTYNVTTQATASRTPESGDVIRWEAWESA